MKTLIVDDHKINYLLIKNLLREYFPEIGVTDEADSVKSALSLLEHTSYHLIFLDMQLKDGRGFDILSKIPEYVNVVVISSYENYALEAFKHNVIDYLIKPIDTNAFKNAVGKALKLQKKEEEYKKTNLFGYVSPDVKDKSRLFVHSNSEYFVVDKSEIIFIKAHGKYSEIFTNRGGRYISSKNLKDFDDLYDDTLIRVHNSYLVNVNYISSYFKSTSVLKLNNGSEIPVSGRKKEELFKVFKVF